MPGPPEVDAKPMDLAPARLAELFNIAERLSEKEQVRAYDDEFLSLSTQVYACWPTRYCAVAIEALGIWSQAIDRVGLVQAGSETAFNGSASKPETTGLRRLQNKAQ
ncbi:uncharacterized protein MAM_04543 [Metarhizium album ARSEF 1941]|uniref:Uncharacterized protein n=1 Tax=Metarhizium album (strain ARSEF 1941) TaxID=1081103 RepID=A0A0B2WTZ3_METAS|nr:uncharacterized protein MAM_04543 [Metarhizium album ARSEF 1941]KHN97528.1 hypothetical protein MAM_04543 [Metarhizium album ARSEF 1941]